MSIKSFNKSDVNFAKQNMFFDEQPNVARYDVQRFPIFEKLIEKHLGFFWKPDEVDLNKDILDFKRLAEHEKHIFVQNLSYQTLLDSIQGRAPNLALLPFVSLPELETLIETWTFSETIHSRSYTYILRNLFSDPSPVFDDIIKNTHIMRRADAVSKYYDDLIDYGNLYNALGEGEHTVNRKKVNISRTELKKKLLLCIASINILEGIRFYVSFACSFAFAENNIMEGNAKIISLIARDENLHLAITQNILNKWRNGEDDPEMETIFYECLDEIIAMYMDAIEQEKEWSTYLFAGGSMLGLNEKILNEYVEFIAGKRMRAIGIKNNFTTKNPLSWVDKHLTGGDVQVAPQEVEITNYIIGGVKHDVDDGAFQDIKF